MFQPLFAILEVKKKIFQLHGTSISEEKQSREIQKRTFERFI